MHQVIRYPTSIVLNKVHMIQQKYPTFPKSEYI
jgi:hypothetical protein